MQLLDSTLLGGGGGGAWSSHHKQHAANNNNTNNSRWQPTDNSFVGCFELYGGNQASEELEQLSSECAHACNAARAKLAMASGDDDDDEQQQQQRAKHIDATLTQLMPVFDLTAQQQQKQQKHEIVVDPATQDALAALYAPVTALCSKGKRKAAQLQEHATSEYSAAAVAAATAEEAQAAAAAEASASATTQGAEAKAEGAAAAAADAADSPEEQQEQQQQEQPQQSQQPPQQLAVLQQALQSLQDAGVKSLAEVSAGQIMVLLTLAKSLKHAAGAAAGGGGSKSSSGSSSSGDHVVHGLVWPTGDADASAAILRAQVEVMQTDVQAVADAFSAAAPAVLHLVKSVDGAGGAQPDTQQQQQELEAQAQEVVSAIKADAEAAVSHVRDAYSKLLYVVLVAVLHHGAGGKEEEKEVEQQEQTGEEGKVVAGGSPEKSGKEKEESKKD